ncbi:hypothetical protein PF004_g12470 [Phytophthora fragariae]|uniref:Uncharacterized protein n=1 Tax=Phytophthora fragariae TaxID=53985 RepID=A0A6G0NV44_9STRA|nr:hypothetical protein PF004_g12470 [Phytophthora fragariae]
MQVINVHTDECDRISHPAEVKAAVRVALREAKPQERAVQQPE